MAEALLARTVKESVAGETRHSRAAPVRFCSGGRLACSEPRAGDRWTPEGAGQGIVRRTPVHGENGSWHRGRGPCVGQ